MKSEQTETTKRLKKPYTPRGITFEGQKPIEIPPGLPPGYITRKEFVIPEYGMVDLDGVHMYVFHDRHKLKKHGLI